MPYAVCVTFTVKPGAIDAFLPLMLDNARRSREDEPGCRRFDVCTDPDRPERIFLYEIYDDRAAFDAHGKTSHFISFDEATRDMVADKQVTCWPEVTP